MSDIGQGLAQGLRIMFFVALIGVVLLICAAFGLGWWMHG